MGKSHWVPGLVAGVGAAILVALFFFNRRHPLGDEYYIVNVAALFWAPMMLVFLVFRQEPSSFGFAVEDSGRGYKIAAILFGLLLPLMFLASRMPRFQAYYPMDPTALDNFGAFCRFELLYGVYLFCWEFFFRGFLLFGLSRWFGASSALVQAIPFGIMHYGKPEFAVSFVSGAILGFLALRSKSFMPCFVLHWAISITFDVLVVMAIHGRLFTG